MKPVLPRFKRVLAALATSSTVLLGCALSLPSHAAGAEVAGVHFDDQTTLGNQALLLNGAGVRVKMIIKVYAVGLYVPERAAQPATILNEPGPKSVRIVMLRDVSAERLADALVQGIRHNVSEAEQPALQARVQVLESLMLTAGEARKGTPIQLDYLPGIGTRVTVAGRTLGKEIAGEDFYRALLKIWLGDAPSDRGLKGELLGQT